MIQPSACMTVVCYTNFIVPVHNPDFLFCNRITSSSANAVYEQCKGCGQCSYQLCILRLLLLHWISNWQESHWVSSKCTVVLQVDASDNQHNNVKYFN